MRRELHVRFWEGPGVRFPRATRLIYRFNRRWREGELFRFVLRRTLIGDPLPYSRLTAELLG
jgi:hypothetical protein